MTLKTGRMAMGKTDPYIFNAYLNILGNDSYQDVGYFGFSGPNNLTKSINSDNQSYYDLSLKNWEINTFPYTVNKKFDLIVCTRVAYFSKYPVEMMKYFFDLLKPNGRILIDWGLGDHWRFDNYKVGWVKGGEQEWAYQKDNFLWSCLWDDSFEKIESAQVFLKNIEKFGYNDSLSKNVKAEVPVLLSLSDIDKFYEGKIQIVTFWEDKPQLYIICNLKKR